MLFYVKKPTVLEGGGNMMNWHYAHQPYPQGFLVFYIGMELEFRWKRVFIFSSTTIILNKVLCFVIYPSY